MILYRFFFQAEGGIRVLTVTGVQTCALPIYRDRSSRPLRAGQGSRIAEAVSRGVPCPPLTSGPFAAILQRRVPIVTRSEERRVGKEWGCRWAAHVSEEKITRYRENCTHVKPY